MIRTRGLRKVYRDGSLQRAALDGVDLDVEAGEFVAVLGPSGGGKSTLLAILGALDLDYEGQVTLFDEDPRALGEKARSCLRGERIGFVFQSFHLLAHLTVLSNVLAPALFARGAEDLQPRALALLDRLGLGGRAEDTPAALSGGQRQRAAIARALLMRPTLLLCDEPTGNLDAETAARTIELFRELHREDKLTIVAVTHEPLLAGAAGRVIHLRDGRIVGPDQEERPA